MDTFPSFHITQYSCSFSYQSTHIPCHHSSNQLERIPHSYFDTALPGQVIFHGCHHMHIAVMVILTELRRHSLLGDIGGFIELIIFNLVFADKDLMDPGTRGFSTFNNTVMPSARLT